MSAAGGQQVARYYTAARRHPWVLGKMGDWRVPLGPYTPAQIAVAVVGGYLLVKTIAWWSWLGPVPVIVWGVAIWAVRRPRIGGRAPLSAALGWALLAAQPRGGRIGGTTARPRTPRTLLGGFTVESSPSASGAGASAPRHDSRPEPVRCAARSPVGAVSGVQRLLLLAEREGPEGGVR
ncbi:hypothetical protein [Streptomyces mangrovisoli]|uniref:Uncharacterized protein n=1 Tax=Streptomyces mangrovisoli TaxID=1428628 RepID=A0A1J4NRA3_9ACTN|nr:hypothetical protein [Streptomyces mangrovisoli]OIJ64969.1 hypothetical protein WN71_026155 [Streptomyces mangrovisoli]